MKRILFFVGLMTSVLLLSACQSSQSNVLGNPSAPPETFCEGRMAWSAEITTDDVVDYATFWIAFDAAIAQDSFKYVQVDVLIDGKSAPEEMKYMQAAEPFSVSCTESGLQFEASRIKYTLILPSTFSGEHNVLWKYTLTADLSDGVFDYARGMTAEYKITLNM